MQQPFFDYALNPPYYVRYDSVTNSNQIHTMNCANFARSFVASSSREFFQIRVVKKRFLKINDYYEWELLVLRENGKRANPLLTPEQALNQKMIAAFKIEITTKSNGRKALKIVRMDDKDNNEDEIDVLKKLWRVKKLDEETLSNRVIRWSNAREAKKRK